MAEDLEMQVEQEDTKRCRDCGEVKSLSDFYRHTRSGYMGHCKTCPGARMRQAEAARDPILTVGSGE